MNKRLKVIKEKLRDKLFIANILTYLAFLIIFTTTLKINVYVAFYLLALMLLIPVFLIIYSRR